jgi:hypothetical protein
MLKTTASHSTHRRVWPAAVALLACILSLLVAVALMPVFGWEVDWHGVAFFGIKVPAGSRDWSPGFGANRNGPTYWLRLADSVWIIEVDPR